MSYDCLIVLFLQKSLKSNLDSGLNSYMVTEFFRISAFQKNLIFIIIFFHKCVNVCPRYCIDGFHNLIDRISIHFPAKFNLRFYFVAFCYCNISHIVCNTHDTDMAALDNTYCRTHPGTDSLLHILVRPESNDDLSLHPKAGEDVPVLSVPMSRLILIHKVHIYGIIRNLLIKLRM